jgi:flagellar biosynthesis protein FliQ
VSPSTIVDLGRELLLLALVVSLPMLATALAVGLAVSVFQAMTTVHEQTLATVPKMIAVLAVALLVLPWSLGKVVSYADHVLRELPRLAGGP